MNFTNPSYGAVLSLLLLLTALQNADAYVPLPGALDTAPAAIQESSGGSSNPSSLIQVGDEVYETHESEHPLGGAGIVWEHTFSWPNASYISIHFTDFDLSPEDYVEISSPDGKYTYQYKGKGKIVRGGEAVLSTFWASHIPGESATVKLFRGGSGRARGIKIDRWAHGYPKDIIEGLLGIQGEEDIEAICGEDDKEWAKCYEGTPMYEKSRTVSRLLIRGLWACTGWLVGSEGHILTNNHCIGTQQDADNTDYEFMAEGATCETDCSGWMECPGVIEESSGALVKTDWSLDYSLILLPTNLTSEYGYLQFRDDQVEIGERIYIPQHPGAWGKQLAVLDDLSGGNCEIFSDNEPGCEGRPGPDIGYNCDTSGGSSGSPVIAYNDHLVVALHHCRAQSGNCPNRGIPSQDIVADLGNDLPDDAIGGQCLSGSTSGTLTLANSPYCVDGTIIVEDGNTLTIEPGVELHFSTAGDVGMTVYGKLRAFGTEIQRIRFARDGVSGTWGTMTIDPQNGIVDTLQYCTILHATSGFFDGQTYLDNVTYDIETTMVFRDLPEMISKESRKNR